MNQQRRPTQDEVTHLVSREYEPQPCSGCKTFFVCTKKHYRAGGCPGRCNPKRPDKKGGKFPPDVTLWCCYKCFRRTDDITKHFESECKKWSIGFKDADPKKHGSQLCRYCNGSYDQLYRHMTERHWDKLEGENGRVSKINAARAAILTQRELETEGK